MSKKITASVRLLVPAAKANPSPPVGPALGQRGVNIMDFCKQFNERTKHYKDSIPIPVKVTVYSDRSFTFVTKTPPSSYLIKKVVEANKDKFINLDQLYEIAKIKQTDLPRVNQVNIVTMMMGTARSMGVQVKI